MSSLPLSTRKLVQRLEVPEQRVAVISFSEHWLVLGRFGDLDRVGLAGLPDEAVIDLFRDLCMGLSRVRGTELKQLGLPNGAVVDLHLVSEAQHWHVVLIDVADTVESLRELQQRAQDAELARYHKSKEVRQQSARQKQAAADLQRAHAQIARLSAERELWLRHAVACARVPTLAARFHAAFLDLAQSGTPTTLPGDEVKLWLDAAFADELLKQRLKWRSWEVAASWSSTRLACCVWLLTSALARSQAQPASAEFKTESGTVALIVHDDGADYASVASDALWSARAPDWSESQGRDYAWHCWLFASGEALLNEQGRATRHWSAALRMRLTVSWPSATLAEVPSESTLERRLPARVVICDGEASRSTLLAGALRRMGCSVDIRTELPAVSQIRSDIECLLLDPELSGGQGGRFAFQLKAQGWRGRLIALGALPKAAVLSKSFDGVMPAFADQDGLFDSIAVPV